MRVRMRFPVRVIALCLLLAVPIGLARAQESTTFKVDRTTVTSGGQSLSSPSFATTVITGQVSPSGVSSFCNAGYTASFGFFSILGNLPVPIQLQLNRSGTDSSSIDMQWSGDASTFQVYRSLTPHDVLDPTHLNQITQACNGTDSVGSDHVVFYKVVAAPGR